MLLCTGFILRFGSPPNLFYISRKWGMGHRALVIERDMGIELSRIFIHAERDKLKLLSLVTKGLIIQDFGFLH